MIEDGRVQLDEYLSICLTGKKCGDAEVDLNKSTFSNEEARRFEPDENGSRPSRQSDSVVSLVRRESRACRRGRAPQLGSSIPYEGGTIRRRPAKKGNVQSGYLVTGASSVALTRQELTRGVEDRNERGGRRRRETRRAERRKEQWKGSKGHKRRKERSVGWKEESGLSESEHA